MLTELVRRMKKLSHYKFAFLLLVQQWIEIVTKGKQNVNFCPIDNFRPRTLGNCLSLRDNIIEKGRKG